MIKSEEVFRKKINEVFSLEPNNLGIEPLTGLYKKTTHYLKTMPFLVLIPASLISALTLYFIFDHILVRLVSLLQYGF